MIRLEIGLKLRHGGVMMVWATEDKTAVVVVASYRSVSRNPFLFKALEQNKIIWSLATNLSNVSKEMM